MNADADDEVDIDTRVVITTDGGKLSKDEENLSIIKTKRIFVSPSKRKIIHQLTKGCCYICQKPLHIDAFQIDHIVAFSKDNYNNDKTDNMLPACADCNRKKGDKSLVDFLFENGFTTNLLTSTASIEHLSLAAKNVLYEALDMKHNRNLPDPKFAPEIIADKILQLDVLLKQQVVTPEEMRHYLKDIAPYHSQLDCNDIIRDRVIGQGGFGSVLGGVFKVYNPATANYKQKPVAIKMISFSPAAVFELFCLDRLQHDKIVKYFGYYISPNQCISVVIEYCNFSLDTLIKEIDFRCAASIANPFKVIYDVCAALSHMHGFDCIHRDIKPANILLLGPVNNGHLHDCKTKICDFGTAKFYREGVPPTYNPAHTPGYICNFAKNGEKVGPFTDVFSLGETMKCFSVDKYPRCLNPALDRLSDKWMLFAETLKAEKLEDRPSVNEVSEQMIMFAAALHSPENGINYLSREMLIKLNGMNSNNQRINGSDVAYPSVDGSNVVNSSVDGSDVASPSVDGFDVAYKLLDGSDVAYPSVDESEPSSAASIDDAALIIFLEGLTVSSDLYWKDTEDPIDLTVSPADDTDDCEGPNVFHDSHLNDTEDPIFVKKNEGDAWEQFSTVETTRAFNTLSIDSIDLSIPAIIGLTVIDPSVIDPSVNVSKYIFLVKL